MKILCVGGQLHGRYVEDSGYEYRVAADGDLPLNLVFDDKNELTYQVRCHRYIEMKWWQNGEAKKFYRWEYSVDADIQSLRDDAIKIAEVKNTMEEE